jgi:hypothetical protein
LRDHDPFCAASRQVGCWPACKQRLQGNLPPEDDRQVTCPPDLSVYLPHVNAS